MNLIEARNKAHEGWVRNPMIADGDWIRLDGSSFFNEGGIPKGYLQGYHLDADNWEPMPEPKKPFEAEVWVMNDNKIAGHVGKYDDVPAFTRLGWRKIRVREAME